MTINRNFQVKNGISVGVGGTILVSSGNSIGIGITTPGFSLDIKGDLNLTGNIYKNSTPFTTSQWTTGTGGTISYSSGYVGIGTTNPSQALHVVGNSYVTGARYDSNNTAGTNGQILSSTGTGTSWVTTNLSQQTLTFGTYLTGVSYNGSSPVTIGVAATSLNTANNIVVRDASGNFSASTITATLSGTATQVSNNLTFNNSGSGSGSGATFNGNSAQTISYNTIGAPSTTGTNASGTWSINVTGNAGTATTSTNLSGGTISATTGSFSGVVSVSAGTNTAPSINFSTGTNTGIFSPGTNQLAFTTNGTEDLRILSNGNIGIGTTNPSQALHVVGNSYVTGARYDSNNTAGTNGQVLTSTGTGTSWSASSGGITVSDDTSTNATRYLTFTSSTSGSISTENVSSTKLIFNPSTGTLSATTFTSLSDASLKENITKIENPLKIVKQLNGVRYDWINGEKNQIGLIAQEVEKVIPELVKETDGVKSVAYSNVVALLIEAIKEQQIKIENLERKINA